MKTVAVFLFAWLLFATPAWAVLGQSVESVRADEKSLQGDLRTVALPGYTIHQISSDDGMVVREFVSPDGMVFGVSWEGPTLPNLAELLGSHFAEFQRMLRSGNRRRGPIALKIGQLVVESTGHMRAFSGRAYLTGLLPNSVPQGAVR